MTAQLLIAELSSLIQESKRKNQEIKNAAEKSLNDLKSLPHTSEVQLFADLRRRPNFARPFLLSCATRTPKFANSGIICLQRLIVSKGLHDESLGDVLEVLRECSSLALDIQLKVLQALPSLLQNYSSRLTGKLLVDAFNLCFLLHNSKTAVISHTAAAALQQLVASTFDKVVIEDGLPNDGYVIEISADEATISVRESAMDAYQLLNDICILTDGQHPQILATATLSQNFGLELLESILSDYADSLTIHPEQIHICRTRLMSLLIKILSERATFSTTVRAMRLVQLILSRFLFALAPECEMALGLLNHMLDPDAAVLWKRALCLEVFRGIHADSTLVRSIYSHFDEQDQKRNILRDHLATLVRLASEKPAIIGLGIQSTIPSANSHSRNGSEQAAIQAEGLIGSIGAAVTLTESDIPGISTRWSAMRIPCIEQLDKTEAPVIPASYIYGLTLTCINNFSEGLAKFLLPFTMPVEAKTKRKSRTAQRAGDANENLADSEDVHEARTERREISRSQSIRNRRLPVNPLILEGHVLHSQICTSAHMVEYCWPALLAACSTFLNATLDSDYYHGLIRSFQRFTQVAGLLDLSTPRDAFLTTLGKHSLPSAGLSSLTGTNTRSSPIIGGLENADNQTDSDRDSSPSPSISSVRKRQSIDSITVTMNTRNLLCLRALLNLGIALGPVLQNSWLIILETLQQADLVLSQAESGRRQVSGHLKQSSSNHAASDDANGASDFSLEVAAVKVAATRMFESTSDLPDQAFMSVLKFLCGLLRIIPNDGLETSERSGDDLLSPQALSRKHQRLPSMPRLSMDGALALRGNNFVLTRLSEIIRQNVSRLLRQDTAETGWDLLEDVLTNALSQQSCNPDIRIRAASVLNELFLAVATSQNDLSTDEQDKVRNRGLTTILGGISSLYEDYRLDSRTSQGCDLEIHRSMMETLQSFLEKSGDSLILGWDVVFAIITSIFDKAVSADIAVYDEKTVYVSRSSKLLRSSFGPLQLICSDFISSVPRSCLLTLLQTLYAFCSQQEDLNISLTTITFFQNVSDFLQGENKTIEFDRCIMICRNERDLIHVIQVEDSNKFVPALWLCLLLRLMRIANNDSRLEVRHSALHTLFRIFDTCSECLSASAWQMCHTVVVMKMLGDDQRRYEAMENPTLDSNAHASWNETAVIIMRGVTKFLIQNLEAMIASKNCAEMWSQMMGYFKGLLDRQNLHISTAVFIGMTKILTGIEAIDKVGQPSMAKIWDLWKHGTPTFHGDTLKGNNGNQDSIVAYLDWLHQISRLIGGGMMLNQVKAVTERLRSCVINSDAGAYSTDVDKMTAVQKHALESLRSIPTSIPGALTELVDSIATFVVMAYEEGCDEKSQTYVALSKSAIDLMRSCVIDQVKSGRIRDSQLLTKAIRSLVVPLKLKYEWRKNGKDPPPWKKATTTALAILEVSLPTLKPVPEASAFWSAILEINSGITSANTKSCSTPSTISLDQEFDIAAYYRVRQLITPYLGLPFIPDSVRRTYVASLFHNSIIHTAHPDDLARPGQELLQGLQSIHIGRTQSLTPNPRAKFSYLLLEELFALVSLRDSTQEQLRLAQAAAPYLILRAGITLKAYVLDQPLRGRMPQPWSEKKELLYILRKLVELNSEPRAIPDAPGITSRRKKHLHRLFGLTNRATEVAGRDEEVMGALREFLNAVGEDFGV